MGLLERFFKSGRAAETAPGAPAAPAQDGEEGAESAPGRSAPRRELVQVVLREAMRRHGIPSDWLEVRILSTVSRQVRGIHVSLVVKKAHEQMLAHLLAFQETFWRELLAFEPRAEQWLLAVSWQFDARPRVAVAAQGATPATAELPPLQMEAPAAGPGLAPRATEPAASLATAEDEVAQDLQALFAIRDEAMAQAGRKEPPAS